jgi:hypothetical protein
MPFKRTTKKKPIFKKPNVKNMVAKTQRKNLVSLIKTVTLKQSETKYKSTSFLFENRVHNNVYVNNLWGDTVTEADNCMPQQGHTDGNREGDAINAIGFKIRYNIQTSGSASQGHYKFFFLPYNTDQGDPTDRTQLTHTLSGFLSMDPIQSKRWKGIKYLGSRYMTATDGTVTSEKIINGSFWIPFEKKVLFKTDLSNITTNLKEKGVLIWYFTGYPSLGPDNTNQFVTFVRFVNTLYYKDP